MKRSLWSMRITFFALLITWLIRTFVGREWVLETIKKLSSVTWNS